RVRGRGVEEVERRTALHLHRGAWAMGEHERGRVEGRVLAPPPAPLGVVVPARRTELARAHDLGADPRPVTLRHRVVEAFAPTRLAEDLAARETGGEHPLVEPLAGVTERRVERQPLTGGEAVE